jgi:hypothetical protein
LKQYAKMREAPVAQMMKTTMFSIMEPFGIGVPPAPMVSR